MSQASFRDELHGMALDALYAGIASLVVLAALEGFEPGFVSRFFNLTWLIVWILATSFLTFLTHHGEKPNVESRGALLTIVIAFAATGIVWRLVPAEVSLVWRAAASLATLMVGLMLTVVAKK